MDARTAGPLNGTPAWTFCGRLTPLALRLRNCLALLLLLTGLIAVPSASWAAAELVPYTTLPGATASTSYSLKVNGTPVFVEKFGDVSMARFAFVGGADLELTSTAAMTGATISPQREKITPVLSDRTMKFSLSRPSKLIVQLAGVEKLLLFADGPERGPRRPDQAGVSNLQTYLAPRRDPLTPVTAALQRAIDETSARNAGAGGVLYVPDGLYMATQIKLKSNVELYLSSGAMIRAVPVFNSTNYPVQNGADSAFVYIFQASNVKIAGRGVIDGNGWAMRTNTPNGGNTKLVRSVKASGLLLEDVYFRDSARWSLHFLYSDDIHVRDVKLINDLRVLSGQTLPFVSNTDGFDIDASTFVTVEDSFVYTTDDAFTPKVTGYMGLKKPAHDIFIRNNVIWTQKCALKVGSEVLDEIYTVRFENNDTVLADRLIALWNEGGSTIRDIVATHNRSETIGVRDNKAFFYYYVRNKPGTVRDIEVNGLQALTRASGESRMEGYDATHKISNFAVRNMYVAGAAINTAAAVPIVSRNAFVSNVGVTAPGADGLPLVIVTALDDYGVEGQDGVQFSFIRAGSLDAPLTVRYTIGGTATAALDYARPVGTITIPAGAQQASLTVMPLADLVTEGEETLTVTLAEAPEYRIGASPCGVAAFGNKTPALSDLLPLQGAASLAAVSVTVEDGSSSESLTTPNGGRFRVARSGAVDAPLTVKLVYAGTATEGVDYPTMAHDVTIPAGKAYVSLPLMPIQDCVKEKNEKVVLNAAASEAYTIALSAATLTIINVDP